MAQAVMVVEMKAYKVWVLRWYCKAVPEQGLFMLEAVMEAKPIVCKLWALR